MIDVLDYYQTNFIPIGEHSNMVPTIIWGDQLTCQRLWDARKGRINGRTSVARLEGCIPAIQEWHFRKLLLQVLYDIVVAFVLNKW